MSGEDREVGLRGVRHRGDLFVSLDDLLLLAAEYGHQWDGFDAASALRAFADGLVEWSEPYQAEATP